RDPSVRPISGARQNRATARRWGQLLALLFIVRFSWHLDCIAIARADCDDVRGESGPDLVREPNVLRDARHLSLSNRGPLSAGARSHAVAEFLCTSTPVSRNR